MDFIVNPRSSQTINMHLRFHHIYIQTTHGFYRQEHIFFFFFSSFAFHLPFGFSLTLHRFKINFANLSIHFNQFGTLTWRCHYRFMSYIAINWMFAISIPFLIPRSIENIRCAGFNVDRFISNHTIRLPLKATVIYQRRNPSSFWCKFKSFE